MTERLYYNDPGLASFDAIITGEGTIDGRIWVTLDRSAFYPTSGGQLHDLGRINGIDVIDITEDDNGEVQHFVRSAVGQVGEKVSGEIDPVRRRLFRQQHTAQHILSQAFFRLYSLQTMSVHLGEEYGAVELPAEEVNDDKLCEAEKLANEVIRAGETVQILFVTPEEAADFPLRKVPKTRDRLRIIRVGDFDWSACGGTHCSSTAEVGMIKVIATEKLRKRTLVKFLAGDKAFEDYSQRFEVTSALSRDLTCHIADLPGKFRKLEDELIGLRREMGAIKKEMLPSKSGELAEQAFEVGRHKVAAAIDNSLDPKLAMQLGGLVADKIGGIAVLLAEERLIIVTAESSGLHAGHLTKELSEKTGLKGGGGVNQAQLGGADRDRFDLYVAEIKAILTNV